MRYAVKIVKKVFLNVKKSKYPKFQKNELNKFRIFNIYIQCYETKFCVYL